MEKVVSRELDGLGIENRITGVGRIAFEGDAATIAQANLWLRTADRVLLEVGRFEADDFEKLFEQTKALPWFEFIPQDAWFPVKGRSIKSRLSSVPAVQRTVKKAVVEALQEEYEGDLPDDKENGPHCVIEVALRDDEAVLTLDTSGVGLHKRGYRDLTGHAPLKETLAAGLVLLSYWRPGRILLDPFCGTGTILIEAAMIGRNIAPGLERTFDCEDWPGIGGKVFQQAREKACDAQKDALPARLIGTDIDADALSYAKHHARKAGVADDIQFQQRDFVDLDITKDYGCIITNPPYGERLGEDYEVDALYAAMPGVLSRLTTWSHYIFTGYEGFEHVIGQEASRRRKLYNAQIACTYYQFQGPRPPEVNPPKGPREAGSQEAGHREVVSEAVVLESDVSPVVVSPVVESSDIAAEVPSAPEVSEASGVSEAQAPEASASKYKLPDAVAAKLAQEQAEAEAAEQAKPTPPPADTPDAPRETAAPKQLTPWERAAIKPVFGGLPPRSKEQAEAFKNRLIKNARHLRKWPTKKGITCYRLYDKDIPEVPLVVDRYEDCLHLAEYERPHDHTGAEHLEWIECMCTAAAEALEIDSNKVFMKARKKQRGKTQHERVADDAHLVTVQEGGLRFNVNLSDYLDTGLFLDHRITRSMVRERAAGKRFLNLFAYTGSFSVYAAKGGAASTTTVDLSNTYLHWAQGNFELNGLDAYGEQHVFYREDTMTFLREHPVNPGGSYDLVVVDPPTFSNSKRNEDIWDVQESHVELLNRVADLVSPGGLVYFSNNNRRFKLDEGNLAGFSSIREISKQTVPEDYRNKRIHRCWVMQVQ